MREMKDSGIEWIGEIPAEWEIIRFKFLHNGMNTGESIDKEYWSDDEKDTVFYTAGLLPIYTSYQDFPEWKYTNGNDLLLARNGTPYVYYPVINACYTDHIIRAEMKADINRKFVKYGLQQSISSVIVNQVSIATWSASLWNEQTIPWLPLSEQQKIADYLDSECAKIDDVITKTKATIEEYKKLKQSVITKAVTKGIRPNREMKDSGIEWIGDIPTEWRLLPFRHVLNERNEKNDPIISEERLSLSIELGVTLYADKTTNLDRFKDDFTQYKLAHKGDLVMNSMNMIVGATGVSKWFGCVSPVYYTFYDNDSEHTTAKFCEYIFRSKTMLRVLHSYGKGIYAIDRGDDKINTCRLKVSKEDLKSIKTPVPDVSEQKEIVAYLDQKSSQIDTLIAKKEQIVTELESYKKSLIYEYVTGKREVFDMTEKEETITIFDPQAARRMQMALAYKVIKQSGNDLKGRIHLMKIIYMLDCMLGLGLGINYLRYTRGPYNPIIESIEKNLSDKGIISVNTAKNYSYTVIDDSFDSKYNELFAKHNSEIEKIIDYMKRMKSSRAEKIATLYAAWNDMVIDGVQNITDKMIIDDVMNNWTENKAKTDFSTWQHILNDMKDKKIIPHGYGKHTRPRSE